jgi:hypothetical protein
MRSERLLNEPSSDCELPEGNSASSAPRPGAKVALETPTDFAFRRQS